MMASVRDKTVVITGAASGIGRATAERIARDGGNVIALDIQDSVLQMSETPGIFPERIDVTDSEALREVMRSSAERFGQIDGAVAAAGLTRAGTVDTMSLQSWTSVLELNLTAVFLLAQATFPEFRKAGAGSFVAIASQVGLVGYPENVAYCAAKGGVINLMRAMAVDASGEGIRSNAVCPGPVDTPMLREGFSQTGEDMSVVTSRVPVGRVAQPDEIAASVCFLLSDDAKFISGSAWTVDGGYTAQ